MTTTCSFSSSVYSRYWRGRINVGTVVNSARRRHDVGGLLVSGCLSSPDSSSPPSSISGPKTKLYVSDVYVFNSSFGWCLSSDELVNWICIVLMLYFRTTEDNLRKAFEQFGKLTLGRKTSGYMNDIQEFEPVVRPPTMESNYPFLEIEEVVAGAKGPFLEDLSRSVVPPKKPSIAEEPATSLSPFSTARASHNTDNSSSLTILLMFRK
ncbi:hypothetical protein HID58_042494 [Brassica napus]|uniref:RRM domain-containing protein n=1 Tax=Brassica napus TaxID=3708 RepID=A0ABQ8BFK8_BRANA|nr:hypothetical protein HID58_042494 [Brassica napus]